MKRSFKILRNYLNLKYNIIIMVTPKQSQKIISWCIGSVLKLLYEAIESGKNEFKYSNISNFLKNEYKDEGISGGQISRMTYELKRRDYLDLGDGDSVKLTNKAKIKLIDSYSRKGISDGKQRLISFDIPEVKKKQRNNFRRAIKKMGFVQIQKSLWACDRNLGEIVEIAIKEFKVENYVAYFVVDKSNIKKHIESVLSKGKKVRRK